jgi:hypothetical protein
MGSRQLLYDSIGRFKDLYIDPANIIFLDFGHIVHIRKWVGYWFISVSIFVLSTSLF